MKFKSFIDIDFSRKFRSKSDFIQNKTKPRPTFFNLFTAVRNIALMLPNLWCVYLTLFYVPLWREKRDMNLIGAQRFRPFPEMKICTSLVSKNSEKTTAIICTAQSTRKGADHQLVCYSLSELAMKYSHLWFWQGK